ncbi:acyltransferase family protein [Prevotella sp. MA2016]|uniref:acyltransferase family protein n=1 Tax=Prevotella sp. MA2016 TaxID=1408310 RepID=UPI000491EACB|nr:acyltransferase family protein [Prevotella sp. MA2016]
MDYQHRLIWIDSSKGWLMVLVVIGHAIQSVLKDGCYDNQVWNVIYSFHMPAFVALSGWLMYKKNVYGEPVWGGVL